MQTNNEQLQQNQDIFQQKLANEIPAITQASTIQQNINDNNTKPQRIESPNWGEIMNRQHTITCKCEKTQTIQDLNSYKHTSHYKNCVDAANTFQNYKKEIQAVSDLKAFCTICRLELDTVFYTIPDVKRVLNLHYVWHQRHMKVTTPNLSEYKLALDTYFRQYKISK